MGMADPGSMGWRPLAIESVWLFFFSSRRRHTRFDCDWSSDVCSSDLHAEARRVEVWLTIEEETILLRVRDNGCGFDLPRQMTGRRPAYGAHLGIRLMRSEERRVGKECRSRWSPYH